MTAVRCTMPLMKTVGMPRRSLASHARKSSRIALEVVAVEAAFAVQHDDVTASDSIQEFAGARSAVTVQPIVGDCLELIRERRKSRLGLSHACACVAECAQPMSSVDHPVGRNRKNLARRETLGQDLDQAVYEHGCAEVVLISAVVEEQDRWPWRTTVS